MTPAAVLAEIGRPLELWDLFIPALKPGQVLVEIAYSGVCRTQLLEVRGKKGPDRFLPHTLGHEGSGVVIDVGADVNKVKPGDRVVLSWIRGSGASVASTVYEAAGRSVNSGPLSTFLRLAVTCESRVTPIPRDMPLREAALLGCAVPTGAGIMQKTVALKPGQTAAIFGTGGIGLSAIMGAFMLQAGSVIAVDVVEEKLSLARRLGASHTINARLHDPIASIMELTNGVGVDCAVEAAGRRETMEAAFQSVRPGGGVCVLAGNLPHGEKIAIDPFDLIRGKRLVGTWGGEAFPDDDIPQYVDNYRAGRLPLSDLITHEYSLAQINEAFEDLEDGRVGRALIKFKG